MNKLWFNENTNELQGNPPWYPSSYVSDEIKQGYFDAGWQQVNVDFMPVPKPLTKAQKLSALNAEYKPQIREIQEQISIAVSVTKSVTAEATWRNTLSELNAEFSQKRTVILSGG